MVTPLVLYLWMKILPFKSVKKPDFQKIEMYFSWKFYLFSISHIILEWYWRVWLFPWLLRFTAILLFLLSVTLVWSEVTFFNVQPVLSIFAQMIRSASKGYYYFYVEVSLFWKKKNLQMSTQNISLPLLYLLWNSENREPFDLLLLVRLFTVHYKVQHTQANMKAI